jgi:multidrug resistance protein
MRKPAKSPLIVIFTTVLVDLIGFGMVIPLISLYGRHYGASSIELSLLGGIYSLMQFIFAPFWGRLSDRVGRRPILLISLLGSTVSYVIFGLASSFTWLLVSRAFGGIFAANISTAQAYIADVTSPSDRAKGMGLIGAAFGIGFTLGPPLGGIASAKLGIAAPGLIAAAICFCNFALAIFRLPESLSPENRQTESKRSRVLLSPRRLKAAFTQGRLGFLLCTFFLVTFAFSTMEQTFSLLFQNKFQLETGEAGLKTGLVLMASGLIGALIQGGFIRRLVPRYGEKKLLLAGLICNAFAMATFPFSPNYAFYFILALPIALGSALINPSLSSLISRSASAREQGETMGLSQGLGSLARATGPFCGLLTFAIQPELPYLIASVISVLLLVLCLKKLGEQKDPTASI